MVAGGLGLAAPADFTRTRSSVLVRLAENCAPATPKEDSRASNTGFLASASRMPHASCSSWLSPLGIWTTILSVVASTDPKPVVLAGPAYFDGGLVRTVVDESGRVRAERWSGGAWVLSSDAAAASIGRPAEDSDFERFRVPLSERTGSTT